MSEDDIETQAASHVVCAGCDSFIDATSWTPVETLEKDGEIRIQRFCDESCREEWEPEP